MKKKLNISRLIWVSGIFIILLIVLYLVIEYKVKYEEFSYIISSYIKGSEVVKCLCYLYYLIY